MTSGGPTNGKQSGGGTVVLIILSLAMFVYVIDTTLMNVSISALVEDLELALEAASPEVQAEAEQIFIDGSINGFQAAIFAGAIVALLGALLTFRLPKVKLKGDALEQAVRSPGIPKVQLEMKDL